MRDVAAEKLKLVFDNINYKQEDIEMSGLKLVTSGNQPPTNGDWLSTLELGTMFLIEERATAAKLTPDFSLGSFMLAGKTERACVLKATGVEQPIFVNPVRFCNRYNLFETLGVYKDEDILREEQIEKEEKDNLNGHTNTSGN